MLDVTLFKSVPSTNFRSVVKVALAFHSSHVVADVADWYSTVRHALSEFPMYFYTALLYTAVKMSGREQL